MDPDDTRVLDNVVRFIGQKVAAVVAETEAAAEEGCRRLTVDYDILPDVFDPALAIAPGAPLIHGDKTPEQRVANGQRNIVAETHGEFGDVAARPRGKPRLPTRERSPRSVSSTPLWKPMAALPGLIPPGPERTLQHASCRS